MHSWFRFSLRTLFVLITVFACWLGYELSWIRQRHQALDSHTVVECRVVNDADAPGGLWLFGEQGYDELSYVPDWADEDSLAAFLVLARNKPEQRLSEQDVQRLQALFPEARLRSFVGGD